MKKLLKLLTGRFFVTCVFIFIQLVILFIIIFGLSAYSIYIYSFMVLISLGFVVLIVGDDSNPTFKVAWIIPMLCFPFFGWLLYLVFGRRKITTKTKERYLQIYISSKSVVEQDKTALEHLTADSDSALRQYNYIKKTAQTNVFENTATKFLPTGEAFFKCYKEELRKAKKFIFLEYFIIEDGKMFGEILELLTKKVAEGVDVRLMYDDLGTINVVEKNYDRKLRALGIKVCIFNPFKPSLDVFMNYRDHRKITVIDGNVGFTGGINLADEYINEKERFGHWKDCGILLKGEAVSSFTIMFLQLWYYTSHDNCNEYLPYLSTEKYSTDGYVMPFGDGPMSGHLTGELTYINMINNAKKYIFITTPYLILDNEMITALRLADQSGVDVRIITPHIPDKWYVHTVTRSNYPALVRSGIRIFEYTPGFIHAKEIIADDEFAVVGTTNFDFRSFYLHFENGVFLYKTSSIADIKADYEELLKKCVEITPEMCSDKSKIRRFALSFMKLFSPFL